MPVLDNDNIDVLREKVDAWRAVERENQANYCEILRNLTYLVDEVNGHPSMSVKMLIEIKKIIADLPSANDILGKVPAHVDRPTWLRPWWLLAIVAGASLLSTLLTLLITGVVRIPIP